MALNTDLFSLTGILQDTSWLEVFALLVIPDSMVVYIMFHAKLTPAISITVDVHPDLLRFAWENT